MEQITTKRLEINGALPNYILETQEIATPLQGLDEIIDDAIQAVQNNECEKLIDIQIGKHIIEVMDNGCGMHPKELNNNYSNIENHGWTNDFQIGIKGKGRWKAFGALCDFSTPKGDGEYTIKTSVGNGIISQVKIPITLDELALSTPEFTTFKNEYQEETINVQNGKLKGTTITIVGSKISISDVTDNLYFYYGCLYHDDIKYNHINIRINGREVEPIDAPHISHITKKGLNVINTEKDNFISVYHDIEFFHKNDRETLYTVGVMATIPCDADRLKQAYPWENNFNFNSLSGVFPYLTSRLLVRGNNVNTMFHVNSATGDTKGSGKFGDTSGSYSGYNRLALRINDEITAKIFGVKTIKSAGIEPLVGNLALTNDYFTVINGEDVSVFNAICYIRNFLHRIYTDHLKGANKKHLLSLNTIEMEKIIQDFYEKYDFAHGTYKPGKTKTSVTSDPSVQSYRHACQNHKSKEKIYTIDDKNIYIRATWKLSIIDDKEVLTILNVEYNPNNKLAILLPDKEKEKMTNFFRARLITCVKYAQFDLKTTKHFLKSETKHTLERTYHQ